MPDGTRNTLRQMREHIGTRGFIEVALHPVLVPAFVILAWIRTSWASRVLLFGQWGRYHGFHPGNALNSFFYKTQWLNFERFGRNGVSPLVGLGNYPLSRWFHLTLLSSCLYANAGAVTTLLGSLAWVLLHLVWLDAAPWRWAVSVTAVLLFSSTGFAMAFVRQNYNILGWMWLPLALHAVLTGHWALAALAWLAASLASVTVIFAALPLMLVQALAAGHWAPLLVLLPALLKLALHLLPMLSGGGLRPALLNIAKMIGLTPVGVRYKRTSMRLGIANLYLTALYAASCGLLWWPLEGPPFLPLTALGLFVANQRFLRFADDQSVMLLFLSALAATVVASPPSVLGIAGLLLAANPLPLFLGLCSSSRDGTAVRIPALRPFDHTPLYTAMESFLAEVPAGARVYFAFADPAGVYERIFDGYRTLLELPFHVAASHGIHLFPDWYAVAETNHQWAPDCWGRTQQAVLDNAQRWGASHAVVYQDSGTELAPVWNSAGFVELASFDWGQWTEELDGYSLWKAGRPPCWWLLRVPRGQE